MKRNQFGEIKESEMVKFVSEISTAYEWVETEAFIDNEAIESRSMIEDLLWQKRREFPILD